MLAAEINRSRLIGCEYEMTLPLVGAGSGADIQRVLAQVLSSNGIPAIARPYDHSPLPRGIDLAVEYDSSVRGESRYSGIAWHAVELKTRPLTYDEWERIVPKALEICRYLGARVNASCGHHVHVSLPEVATRPIVIRNLFNVVAKFEQTIYGFLAPSRKGNTYCSVIGGANVKLLQRCKRLECFQQALAGAGLGGRYCGANWSHLWGDGARVEFRMHHGTLDPVKARHWVRTLLQMTQHAVTRNCQSSEQLPNTRQSLDRFLTSLGLRQQTGIYSKVAPELKETGRYLRERWSHFSESHASGEGDA